MSYYPVAPDAPKPEKRTYEIRDIATGNTLGAVEARTERGAKTIAARKFNTAFAYLSATETGTKVFRPANPAVDNRGGRTRGALGVVLDAKAIDMALKAVEPELKAAGEYLALTNPDGVVAVIGTEGVGETTNENGMVTLYALYGFSYVDIKLPLEVIREAMTNEYADVADFIRVFGSRLDVNAYHWRNFVNGR